MIEVIQPQPTKRLLPYGDPIDGLYWHETGEGLETQRWHSPNGMTCVRFSEITGDIAGAINRDYGDGWFANCLGPSCSGGIRGCNALGCEGERDTLQKRLGVTLETWVWLAQEFVVDGVVLRRVAS